MDADVVGWYAGVYVIPRSDLMRDPVPFFIIGVALLVLAPKKQVVERAAASA
jgi:hypothetical protein